MRLSLLLPPIAFAAALLAAPVAEACDHGTPGLGRIDVPVGPFYLVYDDETGSSTTWIFEESNGLPALQAGGCSAIVPDDCWFACRYYPGTPDALIE